MGEIGFEPNLVVSTVGDVELVTFQAPVWYNWLEHSRYTSERVFPANHAGEWFSAIIPRIDYMVYLMCVDHLAVEPLTQESIITLF